MTGRAKTGVTTPVMTGQPPHAPARHLVGGHQLISAIPSRADGAGHDGSLRFRQVDFGRPPGRRARIGRGEATTSTAKHRRPGLEKIANWIGNHAASGTPGIVTCSALRRVHRDRLRGLEVAFVRLHGDSQLIAQTIRRYGVPVRLRPGGVVDPGAGCSLAGPRRAYVD